MRGRSKRVVGEQRNAGGNGVRSGAVVLRRRPHVPDVGHQGRDVVACDDARQIGYGRTVRRAVVEIRIVAPDQPRRFLRDGHGRIGVRRPVFPGHIARQDHLEFIGAGVFDLFGRGGVHRDREGHGVGVDDLSGVELRGRRMDGSRILDRRSGGPLEIELSRIDRDRYDHRILHRQRRGRDGFGDRDLVVPRLNGMDILQLQRIGINVQVDVRAVLPGIGDREALGHPGRRALQRNVIPVDDLRKRRSGRTGGETDPGDRDGIHRPLGNDMDRALLGVRMGAEIIRKRRTIPSVDEEAERKARALIAQTVQFVCAAEQNVPVLLDLPVDRVAGHRLREIVDGIVIVVEDHLPDAVEMQDRAHDVLVDGNAVETDVLVVDAGQDNAVVMEVVPLQILDVFGIRVDRIFGRSVKVEREDRPLRLDPGPQIIARRFGKRTLERERNEHFVLGKIVRKKHIRDLEALFAAESVELPLDRVDIVLTAMEVFQRLQSGEGRAPVVQKGQRFTSLFDRDLGDPIVVEDGDGHGGNGFPVEGLGDHDGLRFAVRQPGHVIGIRRVVILVNEFPVAKPLPEEAEIRHAPEVGDGKDEGEKHSEKEFSLLQCGDFKARADADQNGQQRRDQMTTEEHGGGDRRHDLIDVGESVNERERERSPRKERRVDHVQPDRRTDARIGEAHPEEHKEVKCGDPDHKQIVDRADPPGDQHSDRSGVRQETDHDRDVNETSAFFDPIRHFVLPSDSRIRFGPLRYPFFCKSSLSEI